MIVKVHTQTTRIIEVEGTYVSVEIGDHGALLLYAYSIRGEVDKALVMNATQWGMVESTRPDEPVPSLVARWMNYRNDGLPPAELSQLEQDTADWEADNG